MDNIRGNKLLEKFNNWFLEFVELTPADLEKLSPTEQYFIGLAPITFVIMLIVGVVAWMQFGRKQEKLEETELLVLDKEILEIKSLQRKRR